MAENPILRVVVPGEPVAQGRPKAFHRAGMGTRVYDPGKSRSWKGAARVAMEAARASEALPFPDGPIEVRITAVFSCPKSDWRKTAPTPRRAHAKKPDGENVAKAVLDAGTGVLWRDDSQVARLLVEKIVGAQWEGPHVVLDVRAMGVR